MKISLLVLLLVSIASCTPKFDLKPGDCYRLTAKDGTGLAIQIVQVGKDKEEAKSPTAPVAILVVRVDPQQVIGFAGSSVDRLQKILSENKGRKVDCAKALAKEGS